MRPQLDRRRTIYTLLVGLCENGSNIRNAVWKRLPQMHIASDMGVTDYSQRDQQPSGNASGHKWLGIEQTDCLSVLMQHERLTVGECDEFVEALR